MFEYILRFNLGRTTAVGRLRTVSTAQCTGLLPSEQLEGFVGRAKPYFIYETLGRVAVKGVDTFTFANRFGDRGPAWLGCTWLGLLGTFTVQNIPGRPLPSSRSQPCTPLVVLCLVRPSTNVGLAETPRYVRAGLL